MEDSLEAKHAATAATLDSHISQCTERTERNDQDMRRMRGWIQSHEERDLIEHASYQKRLTELEGKVKAMETKIAIIAALAALLGSMFGPKFSAMIGG